MQEVKRSHVHMKYIKPFLTLPAMWPYPLEGWKKFLYDLYFYATWSYISFNHFGFYYFAIEIFKRGDLAEITQISANIIFDTLVVFKAWMFRSDKVTKLLGKILNLEEHIFERYDEECKKIYKRNVASTDILAFYYILQGVVLANCFNVAPLILTLLSKPDETGHVEKYYLFPILLPFDIYKYYYLTYLIQIFHTTYTGFYIYVPSLFFVVVLKNITGQFYVLQHRFSTIYERAAKMCKEDGTSFRESCNSLMRECILHHKEIISMVEDMDNMFGIYIFIEYIFTSFGFSLVILNILFENSIMMKIRSASFFLIFVWQPFLMYYYADEVAWESSFGLSQAIFGGDWVDIEMHAQKMLPIVIARAQKPLQLSIGPFKKVSVDSMIALFKGSYSYLSVMWR